MYSKKKIKFVKSCLNKPKNITKKQLKIIKFAIIKSIPKATLTNKLKNKLTKKIYKSSSKINNCLNKIKLPKIINFSSKKIHNYINIIIKNYKNIKKNAYLVIPQINYTINLNIKNSSSKKLLSNNSIKKNNNSPNNYFKVKKI